MLTRSALRRTQLTTPSASSSPGSPSAKQTSQPSSSSFSSAKPRASRLKTKAKPSASLRGAKKSIRASKVQCGNLTKTLTKDCCDMTDSTDLWLSKDYHSLRLRLERDGFLFVRKIVCEKRALRARRAMIDQAQKDGSIIDDGNHSDDAWIAKVKASLDDDHRHHHSSHRMTYAQGYCFDGLTGVETNERPMIDNDAWQRVCQSSALLDVYNGPDLRDFWDRLFVEVSADDDSDNDDQKNKVDPLISQTFVRLMGDSATQEHADYYYFKRDTNVFSKDNRISEAMNAALQYSHSLLLSNDQEKCDFINDIPESILTMLDDSSLSLKSKLPKRVLHAMNQTSRVPTHRDCVMCGKNYDSSQIDYDYWLRASVGDFGTAVDSADGQERWHCPKCAAHDLAVYTTWVSLSDLQMPKDSALCVVPGSHRLRAWDWPLYQKQLPGDFIAKLSQWQVPFELNPGDVIIFNIKTIHASTLNRSSPKQFRLSCDTRIQLIGSKRMIMMNEDESRKKKASKTKLLRRRKKKTEESGLESCEVIDDDDECDSHASPKKRRRKSPKKRISMPRTHAMMTRSRARAAANAAQSVTEKEEEKHEWDGCDDYRRITRSSLRATSVESEGNEPLRDEFKRLGF